MGQIQLVHYCTFKGFPEFHLARSIFFQACVDRIDPKEDFLEKEIFHPGPWWAGIHDDMNMTSGINIYCIGDGSYISDHKFNWTQLWLQAKNQGDWSVQDKVKFDLKL